MSHSNLPEDLLNELKARLEKREAELEEQLKVLDQSDSYSDPDRAYVDNAEDVDEAVEDRSHLETELKEKSANETLSMVEKALAKFDRGEYGLCEVCGNQITEDRLKAFPEAEYCLDHANGS